jgi:hypothetical protein
MLPSLPVGEKTGPLSASFEPVLPVSSVCFVAQLSVTDRMMATAAPQTNLRNFIIQTSLSIKADCPDIMTARNQSLQARKKHG